MSLEQCLNRCDCPDLQDPHHIVAITSLTLTARAEVTIKYNCKEYVRGLSRFLNLAKLSAPAPFTRTSFFPVMQTLIPRHYLKSLPGTVMQPGFIVTTWKFASKENSSEGNPNRKFGTIPLTPNKAITVGVRNFHITS